ncbi:MAG: glutathione S-transferase family protein [Microcoleaceae cyanobacterium]
MLLLQFSTSHYCRKARLALGYKQVEYHVQNLTPGVHWLKLKPLTGLTTVPVLLPEQQEQPQAIGDSSRIFQFLESNFPHPPILPDDPMERQQALMLEDWLDESIGTATRFVYYDFRAHEGKSIDSSLISQAVIQIVRRQYGINAAAVKLAETRLKLALEQLILWQHRDYLVGNHLTVADLAAAALLSPLALLPHYRQTYSWLFEAIARIHHLCHEPLPPGL